MLLGAVWPVVMTGWGTKVAAGYRDVGLSDVDPQDESISRRALAMLSAVSDGRGELVCGCEPDLLIDGMGCCDQYTAHRLAGAGLIRPVVRGAIGQRVPAELTVAGRAVLSRR